MDHTDEQKIREAEEKIVALVREQTRVKDEAREAARGYREQLEDIQTEMDRHLAAIDEVHEPKRQLDLPVPEKRRRAEADEA